MDGWTASSPTKRDGGRGRGEAEGEGARRGRGGEQLKASRRVKSKLTSASCA